MVNISDIRNIVLLGHGGSGKTSLSESILHKTGAINRLGTIEGKSTVSDFDEEEKQRQHSVHSALLNTTSAGKKINLIDTPGYPGFIGSSLLSIAAAETGIIVVNASSGIEVITRKMYNTSKKHGQSRIVVINKIDSDTADLEELVSTIQSTFGSECRCANVPTSDKSGVVDCIVNESGDGLMDVGQIHTDLIETIVEIDDDLMEAYLSGEEISPEQIAKAFVQSMVAGTIVPIVFTNARGDVGVTELIDLIVKYAPSPDQVTTVIKAGEEETEIKADVNAPLSGLVFRVGFDPRSNMKYSSIKLFSGKIDTGTHLFINDSKKGIRPGHPLILQGADSSEIDNGEAGDIITLAKLDELRVGQLIHDGKMKGSFTMPVTPEPMFSLALEPASRADEGKIGGALEKLIEEDPCFKVTIDSQTKERVISGLDDLYLRVMLSKMEHRYKVLVNTKQPKIPYRETIGGKADGHYRHKKQSGGSGQFGEVYLRVEPAERDSDPTLVYSWDIFGGSIPGQFEPAVLKGIKDVMGKGALAGCPMQDIKVSVYDGKYHAVDSKEVAFRAAGKGAFLEAVAKAKPSLLEPIVALEITVPADNMGDITGDLAGRRGRVDGQDMLPGNMVVIKAHVPLSEVTQYNSQLKSVTGGQGSYTMELSHYDPTPPNVQQVVVAAYKKEQESDA